MNQGTTTSFSPLRRTAHTRFVRCTAMTGRCFVIAMAVTLAARPASGQRLADLPPAFIAQPILAPAKYGECPVLTRAGWALGGAMIGVMGGMALIAMTAWDEGPSAAHRRETTLVLSGGALLGGAYGWFVLSERYSCD